MRTEKPASFLGLTFLTSTIVLTGLVAARAKQAPTANPPPIPLVNGKYITPLGNQTNVGSFPNNALLSPDGKFVVVTTLGARCRVAVLSAIDGSLVSQVDFAGRHPTVNGRKEGLFYGLAFGPETPTGITLYAARGSDDRVSLLNLAPDGKLTRLEREIITPSNRKQGEQTLPLHVAGIGLTSDGKQLFAANNSGDPATKMASVMSVVDTASGIVLRQILVEGYPFAVAAQTKGQFADRKVYVSSEQRGTVNVVDVALGRTVKVIETGAQTCGLFFNKEQTRLYVANGGSDTVSIINTATDRVEKTILLRPPDVRGLPGATPLGLALSPDEKTLFVTLADMNAVAVVDVEKGSVTGYIPAGWYPTSVVVSRDGQKLFVANAKGVGVRNPNDKPVTLAGESRGQYIQSIIEGTVSTIEVAKALVDLPKHTAQVLTNNRVRKDPLKVAKEALKNPGIEYVIYIIKENRTYDQVLSDLPQGNGDPSLLMFGREVTPNQHALSERFVLLDNFYCCAEVSGDGWNWSTAGMVSEYGARNVVYGYTGKVRTYDYEGSNNNVAVDLEGIPDVTAPPGGYIWDNCARNKVSYRNYGCFFGEDNTPDKKALANQTSADFVPYDTDYADSEAWVRHGLKPAPRQVATFGSKNDPSRLTAWLREFNEFVKNKNLPKFSLVRLGRDHTAGTAPGNYSSRAMVADNDYAVGQLVEAVSKSPYWKKTAIFVVEDDAQNGYDHVDAHRSTAYVISPYIRAKTKDSRFYNTDSMLRTIELFLGLPPLNQYVAVSDPFAFFTAKPENDAPYDAILPKKEIIAEINGQNAYRAMDSARLLNPKLEESAPDEELNDILWHSIKGRNIPAPARRYTLQMGERDED